MTLNYSSKTNVDLLKTRMQSVLPINNTFYPLTLNEEFYRENPTVISIWSIISITFDDFKGIVEGNGLWVGPRGKWSNILPKWEIGAFRVEKHGSSNVKWVNFHAALVNIVGHPGQSSNNCIWHRTSSAQFKLTASDPVAHTFPLRTVQSEAEDLAAFQAKTGKDPTPVHGVSQPPLLFPHIGLPTQRYLSCLACVSRHCELRTN